MDALLLADVKLHALLNTYSYGIGNEHNDHCFDWFMAELSEDEAQAMLDMPWGRQFSAYEFASMTGRTLDEAVELLETLSVKKAWLNRVINDRGTLYCQVPCVQGFFEYHDPDWFRGDVVDLATASAVYTEGYLDLGYKDAGSPFFGPVPVSKDVVKDGAVYPFDDVFEIWKTKNKFSLSPCTCRLTQHNADKDSLPGFPDGDFDLTDVVSPCGHRLETCLCCGEEAQFWIDHGVGREISKDEALRILQQSVDEGFILQHIMSKESETICSCHGDCCRVIARWKSVTGGLAESTTFKQATHYTIECDFDACVKCGTCAERCPMDAITMDGEGGTPQVNEMCFACGQCAYVCPAEARILVPRLQEELLPPSKDIVEMNNMLGAQRFEAGLIW